jgi:hypothetical protein
MEDDTHENGSLKVRLSTWINYLKLKEKIGRLEAGGIDNWEGYAEAMNPEGEQSYEDYCDEIEERWTRTD